MQHQIEVPEQEKGRDRSEEIKKMEDNFPELKCYDFLITSRIK